MKYGYSVKVNGKWYRPSEEVPDNPETNTTDVTAEPEADEPDKKSGKKKN